MPVAVGVCVALRATCAHTVGHLGAEHPRTHVEILAVKAGQAAGRLDRRYLLLPVCLQGGSICVRSSRHKCSSRWQMSGCAAAAAAAAAGGGIPNPPGPLPREPETPRRPLLRPQQAGSLPAKALAPWPACTASRLGSLQSRVYRASQPMRQLAMRSSSRAPGVPRSEASGRVVLTRSQGNVTGRVEHGNFDVSWCGLQPDRLKAVLLGPAGAAAGAAHLLAVPTCSAAGADAMLSREDGVVSRGWESPRKNESG